MHDLTGRTVVVTGGNSGIGLSLAAGAARAGADVAIWGRNKSRNAGAAAMLAVHGRRVLPVRCDVGDEGEVAAAMRQTLAEFGRLDCFFANAGIHAAAPIQDMTFADWREVMRVNLDGAFLTTREAARVFIEQGTGGSMVVVSSTISRYGGAGQASYAASKTALLGLGRTLAVELARHRVRCNILIPGWTRTPLNAQAQASEKFLAATTARTPVRRWADPEEFEAVAPFLADPSLTFHTGNEIVVDGGYTIF
ncbi:SDR family NAD(P)-dependent oxidoreductase [Sporichthya polymorpha]|uniref:SDR family NAD(P)-dependent oxidoreductase n=1 Tax=Sporichthya polymorpha TaxID=35751 RepID=UPI000361BFD1|nr:SDR family NAD(P)-dependent oxidoreductase [Sporichthya polymorpha]